MIYTTHPDTPKERAELASEYLDWVNIYVPAESRDSYRNLLDQNELAAYTLLSVWKNWQRAKDAYAALSGDHRRLQEEVAKTMPLPEIQPIASHKEASIADVFTLCWRIDPYVTEIKTTNSVFDQFDQYPMIEDAVKSRFFSEYVPALWERTKKAMHSARKRRV